MSEAVRPNLGHLSNAVIAFIFAASAPVAIILGVGVHGGLAPGDMASWIFGAFTLNGLFTLFMSWRYRQPVALFWTIPGTVLVGPALQHLSFAEVVGAFFATGALLTVLGLSRLVGRIMAWIPMPIIMAMVAGVFLRFGLDWIGAFGTGPWIAIAMTATFVLLTVLPLRVPPMIGVLAVGIIAAVLLPGGSSTGGTAAGMVLGDVVARPNLYMPVFSLRAMVELVLPLTVTVLAAQNAQGIALLAARGHKPPVDAITTACGIASLFTAAVGCVSTCLAGPSNAILAGSGAREGHYVSALILGVLSLAFGLLAPLFVGLLLAAPQAFAATLAGLALLRVLQSSFQSAFAGRFGLGALITFMVTLSGHALFGIGAPFWGLVFGALTSLVLERGDYRALRAAP